MALPRVLGALRAQFRVASRAVPVPQYRSILGLERLEDHIMPAVHGPTELVTAFDKGIDTLQTQTIDDLAKSAFAQKIPLLGSGLESATHALSKAIKSEADKLRIKADQSLDAIRAELTGKHVTINTLTTTPDTDGVLAEVDFVEALVTSHTPVKVSGDKDFAYLTDTYKGTVAGQVDVSIERAQVHLVLGLREVSGKLEFYVGSKTGLTLPSVKIAGQLNGTGHVGSLADASFNGTADLVFAGRLGLLDPHHDGRLTLADVAAGGATVVVGELTGAGGVHGAFTAKLANVPDIAWKYDTTGHLQNGKWAIDSEKLTAPDAKAILKSVSQSLFGFDQNLSIASQIQSKLATKLPLINKSLNDLFPKLAGFLDPAIKNISVAETTFDKMKTELETAVPGLTVQFKPLDLERLIRGETIDFVKYDLHLAKTFEQVVAKGGLTIGAPSILGASLTGSLSVFASFKLDVTLGVDSQGIWVGDHTGVAVEVGARGEATGKVNVFGLIGAKAKGSLTISGQVGLTIHKDGAAGKIHLGKESLASLTHVEAKGTASVDLSGKVKVLFFKKKFHVHHDSTLFHS